MRHVRIVAAVTVALLIPAACGSSSTSSTADAGGGGAAASSTTTASRAACTRQIGGWMASLRALDSRLDIGLTETEYTRDLGNVSVRYHEIDFKKLSLGCLNAATDAEKAFNDYIAASNAWSKCLTELTCTNAKVKPKLQASWAAASTLLAKARTELDSLS